MIPVADDRGQMLCNAVIGGACLIPCLIWDIRTRRIPGWYLVLWLLISAGGSVLFVVWGRVQVWEVLLSVLPGAFLLILAYLTREKIGYGDGICFLILGLMEGLIPCTVVMLAAFFLSSLFSVCSLVLHRAGKNTRIPFVPFILGGIAAQALFLLI